MVHLGNKLFILMPYIIIHYYICSHLYVIVHSISKHNISNTTLVTNTEDITTQELIEESVKASPLFYVAAVINANQYVDGYTMKYYLGAGDHTTDEYGHVFHNRPVKESTLFFFRVFSVSSTQEVIL